MKKTSDTQAEPLGMTPIKIPHLERAVVLSDEAPSPYRFLDLQKAAWQNHCLNEIAFQTRKNLKEITLEEAELFITARLRSMQDSGEIDLQGDNSPARLRFDANGVPHDTVIYKVDLALPGTAETFYEGPAGSLLWPALAGEDIYEKATKRLLEITDFKWRDLVELPPEFWDQFTESFPELSILTLSGFISQFLFEGRKFLKNQPKYELHHLLPHIYLYLVEEPDYQNIPGLTLFPDDPQFAGAATVAERLAAEPLYHRAFALTQSHGVADMLALYGLHIETLCTATGNPRTTVQPRKSASPEKKLSIPTRSFPAAHFFPKFIPLMQGDDLSTSTSPVWYGSPTAWLPTHQTLGDACRDQWSETQNLLDLFGTIPGTI